MLEGRTASRRRGANVTTSRRGAIGAPGAYGAASGQAGFSLVELLVTVIILAEVLVGLLIIFDSSSQLARAQTHVAELQQSLRVGQAELTRFTRMTGLGGLPILPLTEPARNRYGTFPAAGPAVSVFNNVEEKTIVQLLDPSALAGTDDVILPGSDVLLLRGVFSTPMFYLDPPLKIDGDWITNPGDPSNQLVGTVILPASSRITGRSWWDYPQEITSLASRLTDAKTDLEPLALLLRDTLNPNAYVVAAFDYANTSLADLTPSQCPNVVVHPDLAVEHIPLCIEFDVVLDPDQDTATGPGTAYADLTAGTGLESGGQELVVDNATSFSVSMPSNIGSIGLLEEYRLYVRAEWEVPGQFDTRLTPVLARGEFLPGTNTQIDRVDIADNVLDLQIAVGADADSVGAVGYGEITDNGIAADEVLFNSVDDTASDGTIDPSAEAAGSSEMKDWDDPDLQFHFLRINTLVQARFPDPKHRAPIINLIEDYDRGATFEVESISHTFNGELQYRRRWLQTVVELRNLI